MTGGTHQTLQVTNKETLQDLASLVAVPNILKGLCGVLTTHVEEDFLTTTIIIPNQSMACPMR
jgi:hypothetical protein